MSRYIAANVGREVTMELSRKVLVRISGAKLMISCPSVNNARLLPTSHP